MPRESRDSRRRGEDDHPRRRRRSSSRQGSDEDPAKSASSSRSRHRNPRPRSGSRSKSRSPRRHQTHQRRDSDKRDRGRRSDEVEEKNRSRKRGEEVSNSEKVRQRHDSSDQSDEGRDIKPDLRASPDEQDDQRGPKIVQKVRHDSSDESEDETPAKGQPRRPKDDTSDEDEHDTSSRRREIRERVDSADKRGTKEKETVLLWSENRGQRPRHDSPDDGKSRSRKDKPDSEVWRGKRSHREGQRSEKSDKGRGRSPQRSRHDSSGEEEQEKNLDAGGRSGRRLESSSPKRKQKSRGDKEPVERVRSNRETEKSPRRSRREEPSRGDRDESKRNHAAEHSRRRKRDSSPRRRHESSEAEDRTGVTERRSQAVEVKEEPRSPLQSGEDSDSRARRKSRERSKKGKSKEDRHSKKKKRSSGGKGHKKDKVPEDDRGYTPPPRTEADLKSYEGVEYEDEHPKSSDEEEERRPKMMSSVTIPDKLPAAEPRKRKEQDILTTKTGGAYIPPAKLRLMQEQITDKSSLAYQRLAWEALKKSINGLVNKVNVGNLGVIVRELIQENLVRGRGLFCRAVTQAQLASPTFTHVYAALIAVINTKFPSIGELLLKRLVIQFKRGYKTDSKQVCMNSSRFIAHLVNQHVAHEILALEIVTLLLEKATDDSVEVAIGFLKECGQKLDEVSPKGLRAVADRMRHVLHEGNVDPRTQYLIESCFATIKDKFKDNPAVIKELDLVEDEDQYTHFLSLDEENLQGEEILNVFKEDKEYLENEEKYKTLKKEILGDSEEEESGSEEGSGEEGSDEEDEDEEEDEQKKQQIIDNTETNLVALRRLIYLTIQSSLDFEECAHKLKKLNLKPGQEVELCHMILDCCAQQRTYEKFFGLLAQRFCEINKIYVEPFQNMFGECYETCHRFDTNRLRHVAKLFAHLLFTDAISWGVLGQIRLDAENTTSSKRIFIKILFQELVEYMGLQKLHDRVNDATMEPAFRDLFPRDVPQATMFAINFFTSIGLGGLTEELRAHFKTMSKKPKPTAVVAPRVLEKTGESSSSSSDSSLSSMSSSSDDEDEPKKKKKKKESKKKRSSKTKDDKDKKKKKRKKEQSGSSDEDSDDEKGGKKKKKKRKKKSSEGKKSASPPASGPSGFLGREGDYWAQVEARRREMEVLATRQAEPSTSGRRRDWGRPSASPPPRLLPSRREDRGLKEERDSRREDRGGKGERDSRRKEKPRERDRHSASPPPQRAGRAEREDRGRKEGRDSRKSEKSREKDRHSASPPPPERAERREREDRGRKEEKDSRRKEKDRHSASPPPPQRREREEDSGKKKLREKSGSPPKQREGGRSESHRRDEQERQKRSRRPSPSPADRRRQRKRDSSSEDETDAGTKPDVRHHSLSPPRRRLDHRHVDSDSSVDVKPEVRRYPMPSPSPPPRKRKDSGRKRRNSSSSSGSSDSSASPPKKKKERKEVGGFGGDVLVRGRPSPPRGRTSRNSPDRKRR